MTLVWSERNELHDPTGAVHDCYVCAPLMCLIHGGFTAYPLGEYTAIEREALERSDTRPDEEGGSPDDADLGIHNRYGLALHKPTATDTKRGILTTPNLAVSVGGRPIDAPVDSVIRKYLPNYASGHRGMYLTTEKLWFDPMAPNESPGQQCSVEDVLAFSSGRDVTDYRYSVRNQYATTGGGNQPGSDMGFRTRLIYPLRTGPVVIPKGIDTYRLYDSFKEPAGADATREGVAVYHIDEKGVGIGTGYLVDLYGADKIYDTCYVRFDDVKEPRP